MGRNPWSLLKIVLHVHFGFVEEYFFRRIYKIFFPLMLGVDVTKCSQFSTQSEGALYCLFFKSVKAEALPLLSIIHLGDVEPLFRLFSILY